MADESTARDGEDRFRNALDRHGFGFQNAVLAELERLSNERNEFPWIFEVAELPVSVGSQETHVDFVLRHRNNSIHLVGECKRVNPAIGEWCFARTPFTVRNRRREKLCIDKVWIEPTTGRVFSTAADLPLDEPYQIGLEIRGPAKGDSGGHDTSTDAISKAVSQVVRGANGYANLLKDNIPLVSGGAGILIVPVVFTTASLHTMVTPISEADLKTGRTANVALEGKSWVWFQQNTSKSLLNSLPGRFADIKNLRDYVLSGHRRSVAIVSADGIAGFFSELAELEDLYT